MIPTTMRALQLESFDGPEGLFVREIPTPQPRAGQVLVKMHTAAVNPSDLMFLRGRYGVRREPPTTPGFEGCGTVVAAGPGFGALWVGRRVALATQGNFGTWAEYTIASATQVFPLRKTISDDQGAMMLVNPLTAWALIDRAVRDKHRGVLLNAANSALGRMLIRTAAARGLSSVAIVRQASQVDELKAIGASAVVVSSDAQFVEHLADACQVHRAGIGFDAVAGTMTGAMLKALPGGARVLVYGALSLEPVQVDVGTLLFGNRVVEGFWLTEWIRRHGMTRVVQAMIDIQGSLAQAMTTEVMATYALDQAATGIRTYQNNMGAGKIVLRVE
ncbi:MAG: alcohol dehydrogenase catalytic domain-containing protein [Roseiflexaceae bacterium]